MSPLIYSPKGFDAVSVREIAGSWYRESSIYNHYTIKMLYTKLHLQYFEEEIVK
jgi:hypothetical protein